MNIPKGKEIQIFPTPIAERAATRLGKDKKTTRRHFQRAA